MSKFSVRHPRESGDPSPDCCFEHEPQELGPRLRGDDDDGFTPLRRSAENGFTLVELMVVIVIIGLLAAIVAFNVIPMGDKARIEKTKSDISTIEQALEMYRLQNLHYPSTSDGLQALVKAPSSADPSKYQTGGYIKKLPADPWGRPYLYAAPGQHSEADVWSDGADGKEGGEGVDADIGSWQ
ncbi:type II secretion system protein GspG [Sphingomonas koreensis]|nr:type II secretion system protein GspG [Sphingomonas koreensis]